MAFFDVSGQSLDYNLEGVLVVMVRTNLAHLKVDMTCNGLPLHSWAQATRLLGLDCACSSSL